MQRTHFSRAHGVAQTWETGHVARHTVHKVRDPQSLMRCADTLDERLEIDADAMLVSKVGVGGLRKREYHLVATRQPSTHE